MVVAEVLTALGLIEPVGTVIEFGLILLASKELYDMFQKYLKGK